MRKYLNTFANIAVKGLGITAGQYLAVKAEAENIHMAYILAETAYSYGAGYVDFWVDSDGLCSKRAKYSKDEYLNFLPAYLAGRHAEAVNNKWALLSIKSPVYPDIFHDCSAEKLAAIAKKRAKSQKDYIHAIARHEIPWLVMALPSPHWAASILHMSIETPADSEAALQKMWKIMCPILRMELPDPVHFWWEHGRKLQERAHFFTNLHIKALHVHDEDTDLELSLPSEARWCGGLSRTVDGREFLSNIPSEEVYTAPNAHSVNGRVAITRPLRVMGILLYDVWFVFQNGEVVDCGARENAQVLENFLCLEKNARRMGEIALVSKNNPIQQSGIFF